MSEQAEGAGARVNTGGNAFPSPDWNGDWKGPDASHGMTLRDHFAGQALQGMLNSKALAHLHPHTQAAKAYEYADAMIAARGH